MRLFKRAPATWAALAVITIAAELLLRAVPGLGPLLTEIVAPLVACGLIYAAAAADGGAAPFAAPRGEGVSRAGRSPCSRSSHRRSSRSRPSSSRRGGSPTRTCSTPRASRPTCDRRPCSASTRSASSPRCRSCSSRSTRCWSGRRREPRSRRAAARSRSTRCRCSSTPRHRWFCSASGSRRWGSGWCWRCRSGPRRATPRGRTSSASGTRRPSVTAGAIRRSAEANPASIPSRGTRTQ